MVYLNIETFMKCRKLLRKSVPYESNSWLRLHYNNKSRWHCTHSCCISLWIFPWTRGWGALFCPRPCSNIENLVSFITSLNKNCVTYLIFINVCTLFRIKYLHRIWIYRNRLIVIAYRNKVEHFSLQGFRNYQVNRGLQLVYSIVY